MQFIFKTKLVLISLNIFRKTVFAFENEREVLRKEYKMH